LVSVIRQSFPESYNRYFEPFIGGGALFFSVAPEYAFVSDVNPDLINLYKVIRDNVEDLIENLSVHVNSEQYFYELRNADRTILYNTMSNVQRASRTLFLNKTCFNGLYRMNSLGQFNVPFGNYSNPNFIDETNLHNCSNLLQSTEISLGTFQQVETKVQRGDLVYFDPPYVPVSNTSSFTKYYKDDFDLNMQFELFGLFSRLTKKGVSCMLSNSYTPFILDLYKEFNVTTVDAARAINCKGNRRGKIKEVLITNY
jgi:DNA adenine methylase